MTVEDRLTTHERRRLEALAQAINYHAACTSRGSNWPSAEEVTATARVFADWIETGEAG